MTNFPYYYCYVNLFHLRQKFCMHTCFDSVIIVVCKMYAFTACVEVLHVPKYMQGLVPAYVCSYVVRHAGEKKYIENQSLLMETNMSVFNNFNLTTMHW